MSKTLAIILADKAVSAGMPREYRDALAEDYATIFRKRGVDCNDPENCEGCGKPATTIDSEGVPLCAECMSELVQSSKERQ